MNELTIELTNFCEHDCNFCSTNTTISYRKAFFLKPEEIAYKLDGKRYDRINLSGGEPLAHPHFYHIVKLCEEYTDDLVIYSNLIKHLVYNTQVIDGVYLEADVTVTPETDKIRILRRVKQGREEHRPEVSLSRNHREECSCDHTVMRYDGKMVKTPCNKFEEVE